MEKISEFILLFAAYSLIGWACETIYCSIPARKLINRGFLSGPFCPVYGFGGLITALLLSPLAHRLSPPFSLIALYLIGMICMSILEYVTGFLLETLFHTKWWDYSNHKFQLHGRVCLLNSLLFGLMGVLVTECLHPFLLKQIHRLPFPTVFAAVFLLYFCVDCVLSVRSALLLSGKLGQLQQVLDELKGKAYFAAQSQQKELSLKLESLKDKTGQAAVQRRQDLQKAINQLEEEHRKRALHLNQRRQALEQSLAFTQRRLLRAFPHMTTRSHSEALHRLKEAAQRYSHRHRGSDNLH